MKDQKNITLETNFTINGNSAANDPNFDSSTHRFESAIRIIGSLFLIACYLFLAESVLAGQEEPSDQTNNFSSLWLVSDEPIISDENSHKASQGFPALGLDTDIKIEVSGPLLRATVKQRFKNPSQSWAEGKYSFPLPVNAAVDRFKMYVGDRVIEGQIKEKQAARKQYQEAKQSGRRASLLSHRRSNVFNTDVANIEPGGEITIEFEYQQAIDFKDHNYSFRLPMVSTPKFTPPAVANTPGFVAPNNLLRSPGEPAGNPVSIEAIIQAGFPIKTPVSQSHAINTQRLAQDSFKVDLPGLAEESNRDFQLSWQVKASEQPMVTMLKEEQDDGAYGMLMVMPPRPDGDTFDTGTSRELILVLDVSGSMQGESIIQAKSALIRAIESLDDTDKFNVVLFNNRSWTLFETSQAASSHNRRSAISMVNALSANGGTHMLPALNIALARSKLIEDEITRLRQVVFITDGAIGNEDQLLNVIEQKLGSTRLFTVGIGSAPNSYFMRKAARAGRGTFTYVSDPNEVDAKIGALLDQLSAPALTHLSLSFPQADIEVLPDPLPDLYLGEPLYAIFEADEFPTEAYLRGYLNGTPSRLDIPLNSTAKHNGLAVEWAQKKIALLLDQHRKSQGIAQEALKNQITNQALKHHQVSPFTSLVAVDVTPVRAGGELRTQQIPANRPKGYENDLKAKQAAQKSSQHIRLAQTATDWKLQLMLGCLILGLSALLLSYKKRSPCLA